MIYRYLDILVAKMNDDKEIYHFKCYQDTLSLKSASENHRNVNYLDVKLEIKNGALTTGVYEREHMLILKP